MAKKSGYVYIVSNKLRTVLYTGVTSTLLVRVEQHRQGIGSSFTSKYKCKELMGFECYEDIREAINREKQMKNWKRAWKLKWIQHQNPKFEDLYALIIKGDFEMIEPSTGKGIYNQFYDPWND